MKKEDSYEIIEGQKKTTAIFVANPVENHDTVLQNS